MPFSKYQATVTEIRQETPRVKTFKVTWPGIENFSFIPGQFMQLSVPGFLNQAGITMKRSYSIASSPLDKGFVEFTITYKTPHGLSARTHALKVGDIVQVEGPAGVFNLKRPVRDNITFVASGSGISSLRAMFKQLLQEGHPGNIWVVFGFHAQEDFIFRQELEELQRKHPNFKVIPSITVDDPSWTGERGRVTAVLPKVITDAASRDYYLCGSAQMVEDTIKVLTEMGVPRHQIFREVW